MKWYEITPKKSARFKLLSEFLNQNGMTNELVTLECAPEALKENILQAQEQSKLIRFSPTYFDQASMRVGSIQSELEKLKSVDSLFFNKKFWPENLFRESFFQYISLKVKNMDVTQKALVLGSCGLTRAVVAGLVKLGFSKINVSSQNEGSAQKMISDFNQIFFNTQFEFTRRDQLTLLPGVHGVVVNTYSFEDSDDYLNEIYFFNFLKKGGLVVDLCDVPVETPFTHIGKDIGAMAISGFEIMGFYDIMWAERAFAKKIDFTAYVEFLRSHLAQEAYNQDKYKKILAEYQI